MDVITFPENRSTTSGLLILLDGIISLRDAMSREATHIHLFIQMNRFFFLYIYHKTVLFSNSLNA